AAVVLLTLKSLFMNLALPVTLTGNEPRAALAAGFSSSFASVCPLAMFFGTGATLGGTPTRANAMSSSKPAALVAVMVSVAVPRRIPSAVSNLAVSRYGGFSVTARPSCVSSCRGGYDRPAIAGLTVSVVLAYSITSLPLIWALPWMIRLYGPIATLGPM